MQKTCKSCGDIFSADQDWKTYCIPCFIKMKKAQEGFSYPTTEAKKESILTEEMLSRIIRLCHPDKHKSSEASHVATVFLLGMRDEMRGAK
jgi:integrase